MRIYIDESGNFVARGMPPSSFSVVLALVVPSTVEVELFYEFLRLRDSWPKQEIEIKGSSLDESQAAQVIELLRRFDVIVEFLTLDLAAHTCADLDDFKSRSAGAITANLTPSHGAKLSAHLHALAACVRGMSNQLYVQATLTMLLFFATIQNALLYYVQRLPEELGDIAWFVDRKDRTITQMEEAWSTLVLPLGESHFAKTPLIALEGADYSHFDHRYRVDPDEDMKRHLDWVRMAYGVPHRVRGNPITDAKRLMTEQLEFGDSRASLGLQLADMLASILRRALNGKLQPHGWREFGRLLVQERRDETSFLQFTKGDVRTLLTGQAGRVARAILAKAKPMVSENL